MFISIRVIFQRWKAARRNGLVRTVILEEFDNVEMTPLGGYMKWRKICLSSSIINKKK